MTIAVDFDGTIVEHRYPEIGNELPFATETLKMLIADHHKLILWSVREGKLLDDAVNWCRERKLKVGLTLGCYTPLCFVDESIYDIDRLHIVTHGVDETDGKDNWGWRKSAIDLVQRARKMIDEKNPKCELAIDGGLRADNMEKLIECNPDVIVLSSAIFKDPEGPAAGVARCRKAIDEAAAKFNLE